MPGVVIIHRPWIKLNLEGTEPANLLRKIIFCQHIHFAIVGEIPILLAWLERMPAALHIVNIRQWCNHGTVVRSDIGGSNNAYPIAFFYVDNCVIIACASHRCPSFRADGRSAQEQIPCVFSVPRPRSCASG